MAVAIALTVSGLWSAAAPPDVVVELAYAVIGWQAGVRFTRDSLRTVITVLPLACLLIVAIIAACAGLGLLLSAATGTTVLEGYLATTPGGVYAVLATAISAGGDVTFVVATQVLRVIVMLLVAPGLLAAAVRRDYVARGLQPVARLVGRPVLELLDGVVDGGAQPSALRPPARPAARAPTRGRRTRPPSSAAPTGRTAW